MENNYYSFDSKGSISTIAVEPALFMKAIELDDWTENGGRYILDHLLRAEHHDYMVFPIEFLVTEGRILRDIIEIRCVSGFLISNRIKTIFEQYGLTGWKTYDVLIKDKKGDLIPGYYGFQVTGKSPMIIPNHQAFYDFFRPEIWHVGIVCSQRVVDVLIANKIKDFDICLLTEMNGEIIEKRVHI